MLSIVPLGERSGGSTGFVFFDGGVSVSAFSSWFLLLVLVSIEPNRLVKSK